MVDRHQHTMTPKEELAYHRTFCGRVKPGGAPGWSPRFYTRGHVYIFDEIDTVDGEEAGEELHDPQNHHKRCKLVRDHFTEHTEYTVHRKRFPRDYTAQDVINYWTLEMNTKAGDELVIAYYHGQAYGKGDKYKWKFSANPKIEISPFEIINIANESSADCQFLLDCYVPTKRKPKLSTQVGCVLDIMIRGEPETHDDPTTSQYLGEFTPAYFGHLNRYRANINNTFRHHKDFRTVPETMASNRQLASRILRLVTDKSQANGTKQVWRLKLHPAHIRATGKLEYFAIQIQRGIKNQIPKPVGGVDDPDDDEGYHDDYDPANDPTGGADSGDNGSSDSIVDASEVASSANETMSDAEEAMSGMDEAMSDVDEAVDEIMQGLLNDVEGEETEDDDGMFCSP